MRAKRGARSARRVSTVALPEECTSQRNFAVHCMVFLTARKMDPRVGTLLVSLENGVVQVWSHHISGGFITSFSAIHKAGDYVLSMASDASNEFLFVGTTVGYIKTWLLKNYVCLPEDVEHLCMPKYRLMFPFLWGSRFMGRAMRLALTQEKPMLMNSYRGHFMPISGLTYINENKILISCCADFSARMWTLSGRYLQTIGTFKPWKHIERGIPVPDTFEFTIPPDIRRTCSSTSLRVLHGGTLPKGLTFKQLQKQAEKNVINVDHHKIYGKPLDDPILGHHYNIPQRTTQPKTIQFDTSLPYIPVYQHLITPNPVPIVRNYPSSRRSSIRKSKDKDVKM
ncbi:unnamed protein product [Acanthoscelides obtectus]|nr:unnamed protein product [Acanthoscelides obtectus]CAK1624798.1 WD repeat-containing protein on Y chromosome [Acanthoscelides obtectus]